MLKHLRFLIFKLQETKLPERLINTTNERRLVQGHEIAPAARHHLIHGPVPIRRLGVADHCPTRRVFSGTGLKLVTCQSRSDTLTTGYHGHSSELDNGV
ncbi:hypothetical protein TNCV_3420791 [Trichonephila clavipes]|nr:hypothetical protein TNCV_3420791 [Trichonephila clavipes]